MPNAIHIELLTNYSVVRAPADSGIGFCFPLQSNAQSLFFCQFAYKNQTGLFPRLQKKFYHARDRVSMNAGRETIISC
jgi:hypothetical protein